MKAVYFAWMRERVGKSEEVIAPPEAIVTVADVIDWLSGQSAEYAYAFENPRVIRVALDKAHARHDAPIKGAREIAFFPPMTGG